MESIAETSLWHILGADLARQGVAPSMAGLLKTCLANRVFRAVVSMRLCRAAAASDSAWGRLLLPLLRLAHRWNCRRAGMDLSWQASVAAGLAVTHGWGLVVSPGATIGRNCTLFHGATLGRGDRIGQDGSRVSGFPVVEDDVWIGPHAIVVGGVRVGRGSRILGGAFVGVDVPPRSLVGGNPARIIRENIVPDVVNPID
ncbi:MAG: serine acetyltransferase [Rhodocyclaceae bacterium]|nr:serine acetyltransferase [Rhodocyclaceae bacterium]